MAARIGIELSPFAWRLVELEAHASIRDGARAGVRSFASLPPGGALATDQLSLLKDRRASVVIWGLTTEHRQVVVTDAPYDRMLDEARQSLQNRALAGQGCLVDIAPVAPADDVETDEATREVMLVSAPASDVYHALRPVTLAGIKVDRVFTPAAALLSLARTRRSLTAADSVEAYVVIEETASCVALIRSGTLVAARELPWGYLDQDDLDMRAIRPRHDIATRLGEALADFLTDYQVPRETFTQVCVCGGVPELRSATLPLMEILDVEVETLDSLFGIDEANLPQPADTFRERIAELRLAWAAAADDRPPLDLLRARRRRVMKVAMSQVAVVAGVVFGLGAGWAVQERLIPVVNAEGVHARRDSVDDMLADATPITDAAAPDAGRTTAPSPVPSRTVESIGPTAAPDPLVAPPSALPAIESIPVMAAPLDQLRDEPTEEPAMIAALDPPPASQLKPLPALGSVAESTVPARPSPPVTPAPQPQTSAPQRGARPPQPAAPRRATAPLLPFEADLATILYGPNRQVALVDGRVVEAGDVVRGARVVEITRSAVMLRDGNGRLRELTADTGREGRQ